MVKKISISNFGKMKKFLGIVLILIIISIFLSFFLDIKNVLIILFSVLLIVGYCLWKEKIGQEVVIAFLLALFVTSYHIYEYTTPNLFIGRINLFPVISWTFGLVLLREVYEKVLIKNKFIIISLFYILGLFLIEFLGYHFLNIKLNSDYTSLFGLGIIHAPFWMKTFYVLIGPIYLAITDYLKVK